MEEADNNNLKDGVGLSSENEGTTSECKSCPSELTPDSTFVQKEVLNEKEDVGSCGKPEFWVQLQNLPHSMRHRNIKPFLTSRLGVSEISRVRLLRDTIYFTLPSQEEATKAVNVLNGVIAKGRAVRAAIGSPKWPRRHQRNEKSMAAGWMGVSRGGGLLARPVYDTAPIHRTSDEIPHLDADKIVVRSGGEVVTPLTDMPYSEQLKRKMNDATVLVNALLRQMAPAGVENARKISATDILQPIRYSSRTIACYNKCEFTVGRGLEGKMCVGFVAKKQLSVTESFIVSVDKYTHISEQMKRIVNAFQKFVVDSGEEPFNELERSGVWKSLTVRECGGDVLIMVTVLPMKDIEREEQLKKALVERFLRNDNLSNDDSRFRVTSIYWERIADGGKNFTRENIGGAPHIYETIDGTRFRILPGTYFPTNSYAARVFFSTIAEKTGLLNEVSDSKTDSEKVVEDASVITSAEEMLDDDYESIDKSRQANDSGTENGEMEHDSVAEESASKVNIITQMEQSPGRSSEGSITTAESCEKNEKDSVQSTNVLSVSTHDEDMPQERNYAREETDEREESAATKRRKLDVENMEEKRVSMDAESTPKGNVILNIGCGMGSIGLYVMCLLRNSKHAAERKFLFGSDLLSGVIEGAKLCARDNGFTEEQCRFLAGRTEDVVPILHDHLPVWANESEVNMVGILDPPRGRINDNVAIACRKLSCMKRLIFVSSEPSLALRNLVDLCKPKWKRYEGEPFKLASITPIDMFPHTERCEWVVQLDRHS
uniref:tRNA (uracil(54)-C(5))-methyltransferase n=1 Tax=Ascaris suum TaxID=6253 RepID=F1KUW7_ASCSU